MYNPDGLIIVTLISRLSSCMTRFLNLLPILWDLFRINNDIMSSQMVVDVVGEINVMGSGDVMSWQMKSGKYGGA
jgi:hypothetical protein